MAALRRSRLGGIALVILVAILAYRFLTAGTPRDATSDRRATNTESSSDPGLASSQQPATTGIRHAGPPPETVRDEPTRTTRRLFGEVVDGATGKSLSGALVTAIRARYGPTPLALAEVARARSDASGRFEIAVPVAWGQDALAIRAESADAALAYSCAEPTSAEHVVLACLSMPSIHGRVVGAPTEAGGWRAVVRVYGDLLPEHPQVREVEVDSDGRFRIAGVRDAIWLQASVAGRLPSKPVSGLVETLTSLEIELVLGGPASERRIRVLLDGVPCGRGFEVSAGNSGDLLTSYVTDANGDIRVVADPARPLALGHEPHLGDSGEWITRPAELTLPSRADGAIGEDEFPIESGCTPRVVVTAGGAPASGIELRWGPVGGAGMAVDRADDAGVWRPATYRPIAAGEYKLVLSDSSIAWRGMVAPQAPREIHVELGRVRVSVVVRDEALRPVGDSRFYAALEASRQATPKGRRLRETMRDARSVGEDGRVDLYATTSTDQPATFRLGNGDWHREVDLDSMPRDARGDRMFVVRTGEFGTIEGQYRLPSGAPIPGGRLHLVGTAGNGGWITELTLDAEGRVYQSWLSPGRYRATVYFAGRARELPEFEVLGGGRVDVSAVVPLD